MFALAFLLQVAALASNVSEMLDAVTNNTPNVAFDVTGKLVRGCWGSYTWFILQDAKESVIVHRASVCKADDCAEGDVVTVRGRSVRGERQFAWLQCTSIIRRSSGTPTPPADCTITDFNCGRYDRQYVRMKGLVREVRKESSDSNWFSITLTGEGDAVFLALQCDPKDSSDLVGLKDCLVFVTGICDPDADDHLHHYGRTLIARDLRSVTVLQRPPWWTPDRLLCAVLVLVGILLAVILWNVLLHIAVERRSHALLDERLAHLESELKTGERTRLAVELHDSIAQTLTGVAMQLRTADILAGDARLARNHISLATKILDACRGQLRNCIWDLRNLTLDETSIADAIRRTLAPHVSFEHLAIRFNVPRERFSEHTAHTILSIIRELAINAARHGHATSLKIAGSIENDKFLFSVKDNGCGFEPDSAPGVAQGHFGLQGIRDRIKVFGGETTVVSSPGQGTKVTIALNIPSSDKVSNS